MVGDQNRGESAPGLKRSICQCLESRAKVINSHSAWQKAPVSRRMVRAWAAEEGSPSRPPPCTGVGTVASRKWGQLKSFKYDLNIINIVLFKDHQGWPGGRMNKSKQTVDVCKWQSRESHVVVFPPGQPERCSGAEEDCLRVSHTTAPGVCRPSSNSRLEQRKMVYQLEAELCPLHR